MVANTGGANWLLQLFANPFKPSIPKARGSIGSVQISLPIEQQYCGSELIIYSPQIAWGNFINRDLRETPSIIRPCDTFLRHLVDRFLFQQFFHWLGHPRPLLHFHSLYYLLSGNRSSTSPSTHLCRLLHLNLMCVNSMITQSCDKFVGIYWN